MYTMHWITETIDRNRYACSCLKDEFRKRAVGCVSSREEIRKKKKGCKYKYSSNEVIFKKELITDKNSCIFINKIMYNKIPQWR